MKLGAESIEMIKIFDWLRYNNLDKIAWHTANERRTSPQAGAILKRMGVMSGVSDITIARPIAPHHGLFLEVKAAKGKLSPAQIEFLTNMKSEGYKTEVAFGADEAIDKIKAYLQIALDL